MKKILLLALLATQTILSFAQLKDDGYYRVKNYGTGFYVYVQDNYGRINYATTSADMGAILLWEGLDAAISAPASVIYFEKHGSQWDMQSQDTGVKKIIEYYVTIVQDNLSRCQLYATAPGGAVIYLYDGGGISDFDDYHVLGTDGVAADRRWIVSPIDNDTENYFGITPKFTVGNKHYAPFYASFPFSFASSGMKAYTVKEVVDGYAIIKPIEGDVVPASTPVIIECSSTNPADNKLNLLRGSYASVADNKLKGVYYCHNFRSVSSTSPNARLLFSDSNMRVMSVSNGKLVFGTDKSTLSTRKDNNVKKSFINANECYLPVSLTTPSELTILTEEEFELLGIGGITADAKNFDVFNLQGMKVKANTNADDAADGLAPGIYIMNGKKVYLK